MGGIKSRIKIKARNGGDLSVIYNINNLYELAKANKKVDNNIYLSIGNTFKVASVEYIISDIQTNVYDLTIQPDNYGINLNAIDEELEYNFEVTYIVERT